MNREWIQRFVRMMMAPPQVVGVLMKKPGQQSDQRVPPIDPQETKIRGELYVEDLNKRRIVSIRMGWLWVEGTQMKLPLRALNLRQATPGICQPHALALGFTLSNSQGDPLATFWADTEPIYWSWVRAIAAELVRQTPFRAQRCLNFLEILTICPRGPVPLPDSPTETRRRSRSELRYWLNDSSLNKKNSRSSSILEDSRRRARSELRGWSSSNSSDEDLHLTEFRAIPATILPKIDATLNSRAWGCSESSEGSDDSLPWGAGCRSSVDSIDSAPPLPPADTREQRIERYKEARRRENEARSRRVLEEDAMRRKAQLEENNNTQNNNNNTQNTPSKTSLETGNLTCRVTNSTIKNEGEAKPMRNNSESRKTKKSDSRIGQDRKLDPNSFDSGGKPAKNEDYEKTTTNNKNNVETTKMRAERLPRITKSLDELDQRLVSKDSRLNVEDGTHKKIEDIRKTSTTDPFVRAAETVDAITRRLPPLKVSRSPIVRFRDTNANNCNNNNDEGDKDYASRSKLDGSISQVTSQPISQVARTDSGERRSRARERRNVRDKCQVSIAGDSTKTSFLQERKDRLSANSKIPVANKQQIGSNSRITETMTERKRLLPSLERECRERGAVSLPRTIMASLPILETGESTQCEAEVAMLLARCQRVDHYVTVREKLTLFESLSRMGGRLARSTEDLGRSLTNTSPRGKQRARSLHDLNRAARSLPVREMCRLFEGDAIVVSTNTPISGRSNDKLVVSCNNTNSKVPPISILKNNTNNRDVPPCVRTSTRRKHYQK